MIERSEVSEEIIMLSVSVNFQTQGDGVAMKLSKFPLTVFGRDKEHAIELMNWVLQGK